MLDAAVHYDFGLLHSMISLARIGRFILVFNTTHSEYIAVDYWQAFLLVEPKIILLIASGILFLSVLDLAVRNRIL